MDFDTLIAFVLFLVFFVFPSIIKQIQLRKKKKTAPEKKRSKFIFGRIGDQIRKFLKDLEQQAQAQKKADRHEETVWDTLAEDEWEDEPASEILEETQPESESRYEPKHAFESVTPLDPEPGVKGEAAGIQPEQIVPGPGRLRFRQDPLQNAIVLSEILSKPAALRDKQW